MLSSSRLQSRSKYSLMVALVLRTLLENVGIRDGILAVESEEPLEVTRVDGQHPLFENIFRMSSHCRLLTTSGAFWCVSATPPLRGRPFAPVRRGSDPRDSAERSRQQEGRARWRCIRHAAPDQTVVVPTGLGLPDSLEATPRTAWRRGPRRGRAGSTGTLEAPHESLPEGKSYRTTSAPRICPHARRAGWSLEHEEAELEYRRGNDAEDQPCGHARTFSGMEDLSGTAFSAIARIAFWPQRALPGRRAAPDRRSNLARRREDEAPPARQQQLQVR